MSRGLKVTTKRLSDAALRRRYARHIHGIAFRLAGEVLALLPCVEVVQVSGYSQRNDSATGRMRDDYLLSVRVDRAGWSEIDLRSLDAVDPVSALERFDLRRKMTKTGIFKPVEPFTTTTGELDELQQPEDSLEPPPAAPPDRWAALVGGIQYDGSLSQLRQWALDGSVGPRDLVWTAELRGWTPAGRVQQLDGYLRPSRKGLVLGAVGVAVLIVLLLASI